MTFSARGGARMRLALASWSLLSFAAAQPAQMQMPTITTPGLVTSGAGVQACAAASPTTCSSASSVYVARTLAYNSTSGMFLGNLTANLCPSTWSSPNTPPSNAASRSCYTQSFPAVVGPSAVPLTGPVAMSLNGMLIYNALEAGFYSGQGPTVCTTSGYFCAGGMDLRSCESELAATCGASGAASLAATLSGSALGDSCGGHATPYHFHGDLKCEYAPSATASSATVTAHSDLVGIALDGHGIYGAWEGPAAAPSNLDACNGHVGPVPGTASVGAASPLSATAGITGLAASTVYHYHLSTTFPYTVGCYGNPAAAVTTAACHAMYSNTCNTWVPVYNANGDAYFFDDWCPCRDGGAAPATAPGALPTLTGATCYSSVAGNNNPPSSTSGATACTASILTAAAATTANTTKTASSAATTCAWANAVAALAAALAAAA